VAARGVLTDRTAEALRAIAAEPPAAPPTGPLLGRVLADDDPRLRPTDQRPGREALRQGLVDELVNAGVRHDARPTAWVLAGPMGTGKVRLGQELRARQVVPRDGLVLADADAIHAMIPEQRELTALGDGRASDVVHEEASLIARAALGRALTEGKDALYNTMLASDDAIERLRGVALACRRTVVVAVVSSLASAEQRATMGGAAVDHDYLARSHQGFRQHFDQILQLADDVLLIHNGAGGPRLIATGGRGRLSVLDPARFAAFRAGAGED
jgi:predicted ABC-type ATPase